MTIFGVWIFLGYLLEIELLDLLWQNVEENNMFEDQHIEQKWCINLKSFMAHVNFHAVLEHVPLARKKVPTQCNRDQYKTTALFSEPHQDFQVSIVAKRKTKNRTARPSLLPNCHNHTFTNHYRCNTELREYIDKADTYYRKSESQYSQCKRKFYQRKYHSICRLLRIQNTQSGPWTHLCIYLNNRFPFSRRVLFSLR